MSFQLRSEAVGTPSRVPETVWKRVPFHRTRNGESPTTKRAAKVSWNHQLATVGRSNDWQWNVTKTYVAGDDGVERGSTQVGIHAKPAAEGDNLLADCSLGCRGDIIRIRWQQRTLVTWKRHTTANKLQHWRFGVVVQTVWNLLGNELRDLDLNTVRPASRLPKTHLSQRYSVHRAH